MASIETRTYPDKKTGKITKRYKAKIRIKGFPYEEATFDRLTDAQNWSAKREYELRHVQRFGVQVFASKTLADAIDRYEDALKFSNPRRHKEIVQVLKAWKKRLGMIKLKDLSKDSIITERERLKRRHVKDDPERGYVSNADVNRKVAILKRVLNVAVCDWGWLSENPLNGIEALPEPEGRTRFLQGDELRRLLSACEVSENKQLLTIVVLTLTTAARLNEIRKIRLKDINFETRQILLPKTKNKKPRMLFLEGYALDLVSSLYGQAKPKQVHLFCSSRDITRPNDFRTAWRTVLKRAGIDDFHFHDLRHSAASLLAMNGAGLHDIADILGHSSIHMAKRYTHLLVTHTATVVESTASKVFDGVRSGLDG